MAAGAARGKEKREGKWTPGPVISAPPAAGASRSSLAPRAGSRAGGASLFLSPGGGREGMSPTDREAGVEIEGVGSASRLAALYLVACAEGSWIGWGFPRRRVVEVLLSSAREFAALAQTFHPPIQSPGQSQEGRRRAWSHGVVSGHAHDREGGGHPCVYHHHHDNHDNHHHHHRRDGGPRPPRRERV